VLTSDELVEFVKVAGPKLRALDPPVKVVAPQVGEWQHLWSNEAGLCSEPSALPSYDPLDGVGYDSRERYWRGPEPQDQAADRWRRWRHGQPQRRPARRGVLLDEIQI
jgi:hypothetical protein